MNQPDYIGHEEYLDSPMIYGQHAPFWSSLSFLEKVDTIRHVGFFSFLREVIGFADAERTRKRLELKYSEHEETQERIAALEQENQELARRLEEATEKLKEAERVGRGKSHKLLAPPSAYDIMDAFNRNSPNKMQPWFFSPYEDPLTGTVTLNHNFMFYPFASIVVPRGKLRLCNQYGMVANLAQCMDYDALPAKYAQHLVPEGLHAYRMRILFVTQDRDFWLADPLSAQDVVLEIWANYDGEWHHSSSHDASIKAWKERYRENNAMVCGTSGKPLFNLVVSIEELLCKGQNNFSKDQIKRIRDKCYAEYLDIYFNDQHGEEG